MSTWIWILIAFVSFWFGYFTCATMVMARQNDEMIEDIKNEGKDG